MRSRTLPQTETKTKKHKDWNKHNDTHLVIYHGLF